MRIFEAMLDCGIHRRLDTPIEGQREIVTILKEGQKERNDILKETNALLQEILEKVKVRYPNGVAPAAPSCMPEPRGSQPQRSPRIRAAGAGLQAGLNAGPPSSPTQGPPSRGI